MTRVDLDNWQATVDQWRRSGAEELEGGITVDGLGALVAELRAAREEITTYKAALEALESRAASALNAGVQIRAAYDEVVG